MGAGWLVQGRCRKDVGRLSISIIMPAPSPTSLLYNRLVHDDVNGDDLDEDWYHHVGDDVNGDDLDEDQYHHIGDDVNCDDLDED